jgi:CDGSH-type Zn-finger protein/uncharacterized Fe-S cluster protein YjdI
MNEPSREQLIHSLYEAAELEHNLMCTYLYAAFSLRESQGEGLSAVQGAAVARWRREILDVAIEEMSHLAAVWNITAALGGMPRFGRMNFPLDPGYLPAGVVVKLAPFNLATLQHFIHLERPEDSAEPDGEGFAPERMFVRGAPGPRLTPMALDYETVGAFYATLSEGLQRFTDTVGADAAFCGDRRLQLSPAELDLAGAQPVICLKSALAAFDAIVLQGEGAPQGVQQEGSHYQRFVRIRTEFAALKAQDPGFVPAHPAATNPVLRRPPRPEGRVWIEDAQATAAVDLANASYGLMLRLLAYSYAVPSPSEEKALTVDLAISLMRAVTLLAEHATRQPAGPSNPHCNAGMSFTALRDASPFAPGPAAHRFFVERLEQLAAAGQAIAGQAPRTEQAARMLTALALKAQQFGAARGRALTTAPATAPDATSQATAPSSTANASPPSSIHEGVETVEGMHLTLQFEAKRCIHARFCVTGAPTVFLANVQGPWIHPDTMDAERLADIAHACPSGAIQYRRKDGRPDESAPPVNLISVREAGPYAVRADIRLDGAPIGYRATLCRCGASKNKPFCDGSHAAAGFQASGEPATGILNTNTDMLAVRNGVLAIDPQIDGPLQVRDNLEIVSGTGRVVSRVKQCKLCRCGGSQSKPFCDGTHARIGFRSS